MIGIPNRFYAGISSRQEQRKTLIFNADDLRKNISSAANDRKSCSLLLAANIYIDSEITIPSSVAAFNLDGGGKFTIYAKADLDSIFSINTRQHCKITDIRLDAGSYTVTSVFSTDNVAGAQRLTASGLYVANIPYLFEQNSSLVYDACVFEDIRYDTNYAFELCGNVVFLYCLFANIYADTIDVAHADSVRNIFMNVTANELTTSNADGQLILGCRATTWNTDDQDTILLSDATQQSQIRKQLRIANDQASPAVLQLDQTNFLDSMIQFASNNSVAYSLGYNYAADELRIGTENLTTDVALSVNSSQNIAVRNKLSVGHAADPLVAADVNGAVALVSGSVTLNTADPTLTVGDRSFIKVTLGGSSSGNITLTDGLRDGQLLILYCVSNSGTAAFPDSTLQNMRLSSAWSPNADDTLSLIWNGTDWIETARSTN